MTRTNDLYRFFDTDGQLLYVGISLNAAHRASEHRAEKPWWPDVARMEVERFDTREAAAAAEKTAIQSEQPTHNIVHANGRVCEPQRRDRKRRSGSPLVQAERRWKEGVVYAFGLDTGRCPVGWVHKVWEADQAYPYESLEVELYHWVSGYFTAGTMEIKTRSIVQSLRADVRIEGGEEVWQMDPLADFQTFWHDRSTD